MNKKQANVTILGTSFVSVTMDEMIGTLMAHVNKREKAFVVTANPEIALHAYEDKPYRRVIQKANYVTADGIGIVKAASWTDQYIPERVAGFDLFLRLLEEANENSLRVYLLGAKPHVFEKAKDVLREQYPNMIIAGGHHGYFDFHDDAIADDVRQSGADLVFVALGFPRQEEWIAKEIDKMDKGIFIGIGGSFDVMAGEVKRAPLFWQNLNLEWLYRLVMQPTRFKRMLALPKFVLTVLKDRKKRR